MKGYGSVRSNDVVLIHRLAMSRVNSLLGVCNLLRGMYQTDEDYERLWEISQRVVELRDQLQDLCPYDAPLKPEGIF